MLVVEELSLYMLYECWEMPLSGDVRGGGGENHG